MRSINDRRNFYDEVAMGNVPGHSLVHKFGRNLAVPNGSWAFVNTLGLTAWPLSQVRNVRIKASGNEADTSNGAGARQVTVQGILANGYEGTEVITTAGTSASTATVNQWWRIHRAWVSSAGTYGAANTGNIIIESSVSSTNLIQISAGEGQSQFAGFTTPTDKIALLLGVTITVDSTKPADIRLFTRDNITDATAPLESKRLKLNFDGIASSFSYRPVTPELKLNPLTDIWIEAFGSGAQTEVSANFELLMIVNDYVN